MATQTNRPSRRPGARAITTVALALLAAAAGGCSVTTMQRAPDNHLRQDHFDCSDSIGPPIVDAAAAYVMTSVALATSAGDSTSRPLTPAEQEAGRPSSSTETWSGTSSLQLATGVAAAALAVSSVYGFYQSSQCHRALAAMRTRAIARALAAAPAPAPNGQALNRWAGGGLPPAGPAPPGFGPPPPPADVWMAPPPDRASDPPAPPPPPAAPPAPPPASPQPEAPE